MNDMVAAETAIHETLSQVAEAWHRGDPERYAALFSDDADYVAFDGTRMVGRDEIADGHRALFAGIMRGSRMTMRPPSIRFLAPGVAVVCALGGIIMRWQGDRAEPSAKRLSTVTFVVVRRGQGWQVAAFQNTRYRPWSRTLMGRLMTRTAGRGSRRPRAVDVAGS